MARITTDRVWERKTTAAVLVGSFVFLGPLTARAGILAEEISATVERVLTVIKKADLGKNERHAQLLQMIMPRFDFAEMAKRSLGPHWKERTPDEQRKFVRVFADVLADSYLDKLETYIGDKFVYVRETQESDFSEVATKIIGKNGGQFAINYKLHWSDGDWKVYDVIIENVSLVNNYRSQFNRILTTAPFDELLNILEQRKGRELSSERLPLNSLISYWIISAASAARRQ